MCANVVSGKEDHEFCTVEGTNIATRGKSTNTKTKYSQATVHPPSPRKPMLGRGRLHPPSVWKKYCTSTLDWGGRGASENGFNACVASWMALCPCRPMVQYLFHPPTGEEDLQSSCVARQGESVWAAPAGTIPEKWSCARQGKPS